jgi:DNA-binding XRE family transcriptional regulator
VKKILTERKTWERTKPKPKITTKLDALPPDEQANVLAAATKLRVQCGSWQDLANAIGVNRMTLFRASTGIKAPCAGLALRLARLAKVPVEDVLAGAFAKPGCCSMCGK